MAEQRRDVSRDGSRRGVFKTVRLTMALVVGGAGRSSSRRMQQRFTEGCRARFKGAAPAPTPVPTGPVVAVKVDDTAAGRRSLGMDKADLISIEGG
jgi:hypothetical protein